jgi:hypothetical protein
MLRNKQRYRCCDSPLIAKIPAPITLIAIGVQTAWLPSPVTLIYKMGRPRLGPQGDLRRYDAVHGAAN